MSPFWLWQALALALAGIAGWLATRALSRPLRALGIGGIVVLALWGFVFFAPAPIDAELMASLPVMEPLEGYGSSGACRSCHPAQYASWYGSFHRTMTQVATPEAVQAPFDGRVLRERGRAIVVFEEQGRFYAASLERGAPAPDLGDPAWLVGLNPRRVILTTGSHHLQAYWLEAGQAEAGQAEAGQAEAGSLAPGRGRLEQLPFVYHLREQRWLANSDSFLQPEPAPDASFDRYVWSEGCVSCHTTGGPWDPAEHGIQSLSGTAVTELGIACENCHGPAEEHARLNRSPARRYALHVSGRPDSSIVDPRRLEPARAASVCGACHTAAEARSASSSGEFRPGARLDQHLDFRAFFATADAASSLADPTALPGAERDIVESFWTSGANRVAGRELDGLLRSGCYLEGGMSCISCHRVHTGTASKQLVPGATGVQMCGPGCHESIAADPSAHSHHEQGSPGDDCMNCHMPYASYGLLTATRTHRFDSPSASGLSEREAPNACNLCHLDRPIRFVAEALHRWYGAPAPSYPEELGELSELPAGAVWMLRGDAVQRALAAWHAGWEPAREISDMQRLRPALAALLADPYSAVRQLAAASLRAQDPALRLDMDAITRDPQPALSSRIGPPNRALDRRTIRWLLEQRIRSPVAIPE